MKLNGELSLKIIPKQIVESRGERSETREDYKWDR